MYLFIYLLIISVIFPQGKADGVAAIVGDNIILHSDILQQAQMLAMDKNINPSKSPYLFEELFFSTLNNVVNQYVLLEAAEKDTNIIISNDEVNRALDQQIETFILRAGSEQLFLEMAGMSMRQIRSEYWKDIKNMMLIERYQFSKIQNIDVSRIEVEEFYLHYKDSIPSVDENYSYNIIEIPFFASSSSEQKTIALLDSLKTLIENNNISFDSLAIQYSEDPGSSKSGGYLGYTSRGLLVKEFEKAAYSLSINEISVPVKTLFGYHLIKLLDKQGEKVSTQHILRKINFSTIDKQNTLNEINNLISMSSLNNISFDSLANIYSHKYNNMSGTYNQIPLNNINLIIQPGLKNYSSIPFISSPIETSEGYLFVYCYDHQEEITPNLKNSWNMIYQYAKQNKQNNMLVTFVDNLKNDVFIKLFYN